MQYNKGEIVLVNYPFTDSNNSKQRPVIVISNNNSNKKTCIVVKVTSVIRNDRYSFYIDNTDYSVELEKESEARVNEILTIDNKLIIKRIGVLSKSKLL